eukprot:scaffold129257_cov54-Attheya_sp.AAC.3
MAVSLHTNAISQALVVKSPSIRMSQRRWGGSRKDMNMAKTGDNFESSNPASSDGDGDDDDGENGLDPIQAALRKMEQSGNMNSSPTPSPWFKTMEEETLPFSCTGCGNCCRTRGEVYLSPKELVKASNSLDMSTSQFKEAYVSHEQKVKMSNTGGTNDTDEEGWVLLKTTPKGCIFLDQDTNECGIYEARPIQCSTYPFWPRIMKSQKSWNSEVCLPGVPPENHPQDTDALDKYWSVQEGGCEGMQRILSSHESDDSIEDTNIGVSVEESEQRLDSYKRYKRQFPTDPLSPLQDLAAIPLKDP